MTIERFDVYVANLHRLKISGDGRWVTTRYKGQIIESFRKRGKLRIGFRECAINGYYKYDRGGLV